ncbi:hypothetical protein RJ639_036821 [Escallonia herrerae]|uniref:RRM domain-containing protein n=1 Tax=Escallonia herrerae TaxID=1293975 RepID=A0AA89BGG7_9ASTE|nr:hypothetical protein RJ639_036821 [Escallonia herrerae]
MSKVKALYVKNIPENTPSEQLKELFQRHGEVTKVVMPPAKSGGKRDFGFVHFAERSSALKAIKDSEKYEVNGEELRISSKRSKQWRPEFHASICGSGWVVLGYISLVALGGCAGSGGSCVGVGANTRPPSGGHCANSPRKSMKVTSDPVPCLFVPEEEGTQDTSISARETLAPQTSLHPLQGRVSYILQCLVTLSPLQEDDNASRDLDIILATDFNSSKLSLSLPQMPTLRMSIISQSPLQEDNDASMDLHFINASHYISYTCTTSQLLEVVLAKPQSDKRSDGANSINAPAPNYMQHPGYGGFPGNPYVPVGPGYGVTGGFQQPMIYGRGPMPTGMQMVPMVLPDGRIGYVLQQPGVQMPPMRPQRNDRNSGTGGPQGRGGTSGGSDGAANRGRRYQYILYTKKSIALRMSGHLLLGVVRIYEKKVEYLHEDCRVVWISLKNAYAPADVNLPEDATHAPFHSVTLPEKFELDAFDLDDYLKESLSKHLEDREETTLAGNEDTTRETEVPNGNILDIEVMRNVLDDLHSRNVSLWIDHKNDILEPDSDLVQQLMKDEDNYTPGVEEMLVPGEPCQQYQEPPSGEPENFDSGLLYGGVSSVLAIRSTPHVEQPQAKPRKRKQLYDEKTVLSNKSLRKMIDDSNDLLRAERCLPVSDLGVWKLNKRLKMDALCFDPLLTGLCTDLSNIYKKDFVSAKPRSVSSEEPRPELIECIQNYEGPVGIDVFPEPLRRPNRSMPSSPAYDDIIRSQSDQVGTLGPAASNGLPGSVVETPEKQPCLASTRLSYVPELMNSAEGDLSFLEQDDNTGADGNRRRLCARMVFETLVLKNMGFVDVQQEEPFALLVLPNSWGKCTLGQYFGLVSALNSVFVVEVLQIMMLT